MEIKNVQAHLSFSFFHDRHDLFFLFVDNLRQFIIWQRTQAYFYALTVNKSSGRLPGRVGSREAHRFLPSFLVDLSLAQTFRHSPTSMEIFKNPLRARTTLSFFFFFFFSTSRSNFLLSFPTSSFVSLQSLPSLSSLFFLQPLLSFLSNMSTITREIPDEVLLEIFTLCSPRTEIILVDGIFDGVVSLFNSRAGAGANRLCIIL